MCLRVQKNRDFNWTKEFPFPIQACCDLISDDGKAIMDGGTWPMGQGSNYYTGEKWEHLSLQNQDEYSSASNDGVEHRNFLRGCPNLKYLTVVVPPRPTVRLHIPWKFLEGTPNVESVEIAGATRVYGAGDRVMEMGNAQYNASFKSCPKLTSFTVSPDAYEPS